MSVMAAPSGTAQLRSYRRSLRAERIRVAYWRRLVRARLDLAVAVVTVPDPLDGAPFELDGPTDVPRHLELIRSLRGGLPLTEVHDLTSLRALDERLARYESQVDEAFARATAQFVEHLARDPSAAFDCLPEAPTPS